MKFVADEMLGKLARWMRLAGYDTLYCDPVADDQLLEMALRDDRIILTRDRKLAARAEPHGVLLVSSGNPFEQFVAVVRQYRLDIESNAFKEDYKDRIPPHVYGTQTSFSRCSNCDRLYWPGTHYESMRRRLALARETR